MALLVKVQGKEEQSRQHKSTWKSFCVGDSCCVQYIGAGEKETARVIEIGNNGKLFLRLQLFKSSEKVVVGLDKKI